MLDGFFGIKSTKKLADNHKSHKKKNTYVIKIDGVMTNSGVFAQLPMAPLPIFKKNGKKLNNGDWMETKEFPNPMATEIRVNYPLFASTIGNNAAVTIVEFLDKQNAAPVALMFPDGTVYIHDGYEKNFRRAMNHATRRDFDRQLQKRAAAMASLHQNMI